MTQAIVLGGNLERLVAELRQLEDRKATVVAEVARPARTRERLTLSRGELVALVEGALKN